MKVTYIYHSCFLIETQKYYYLFDYYKGTLPNLNCEKPIYVFSSHFHSDHYNPTIFSLLKEQGMKNIHAVLSKDISPNRYPEEIPVTTVTHHQQYSLEEDLFVETLFSTDEGVAFMLSCPEGTLYHAGDLNDWVWEEETEQYNKQMTGTYRHEIEKIKGRHIDLAFLVLDPRQGKDYARGITYFLQQTKTKKVFPMHYWEQPEIISTFTCEYPQYASVTEYTQQYQSI